MITLTFTREQLTKILNERISFHDEHVKFILKGQTNDEFIERICNVDFSNLSVLSESRANDRLVERLQAAKTM